MSSESGETRTRILEATWRLLEAGRGQGVSMSEIALAVGISRQALYLHFSSRIELMIATMHYVDEVKGINEKLATLHSAQSAQAFIEAFIDLWADYIPEVYGVAKALLLNKDSDEAAAAAWNWCMGSLRDVCKEMMVKVEREHLLSDGWTRKSAIEMSWALLSISNWEHLVYDCAWSKSQYRSRMKDLILRTFVAQTQPEKGQSRPS